MDIILLVAGAMLAAIGLVDLIAWAVCRTQEPGVGNVTYMVIRLENDRKKLEDQLRHELLLLQWNTPIRSEVLVFVDDGLAEEEINFCKRMLCDFHSAILCKPKELAALIGAGKQV